MKDLYLLRLRTNQGGRCSRLFAGRDYSVTTRFDRFLSTVKNQVFNRAIESQILDVKSIEAR